MTTIARRTFASTPQRSALDTWHAIVELLTKGRHGPTRSELLAVEGIAASVITDQAPRDAAIIVTCDGPRTRIYCLYDEDAIDGADANEDALGYDPLAGNWRVSLPCLTDDLGWTDKALQAKTSRIVVRDSAENITPVDEFTGGNSNALVLDPKGFLGL